MGSAAFAGLVVDELTPMRDVDTAPDAVAVAASTPRSRFAQAVAMSGIAIHTAAGAMA